MSPNNEAESVSTQPQTNPVGQTSETTISQPSSIQLTSPPVNQPPIYTTSTIFTTVVRTITSCAAEETNCPALPLVTTEIISVSVTVLPVGSLPAAPLPVEYTTLTVYGTTTETITSCPVEADKCQTSALPYVITKSVPVYTTAYPVSQVQPSNAAQAPKTNTGQQPNTIQPSNAAQAPKVNTVQQPNTIQPPVPLSPTSQSAQPPIVTENPKAIISTATSCNPKVANCVTSQETNAVPAPTTIVPGRGGAGSSPQTTPAAGGGGGAGTPQTTRAAPAVTSPVNPSHAGGTTSGPKVVTGEGRRAVQNLLSLAVALCLAVLII